MFDASGGRERGPAGVARGEIDFRRAFRFSFQPLRDAIGEYSLGERLAEAFFPFRSDGLAVDRRGLLGSDGAGWRAAARIGALWRTGGLVRDGVIEARRPRARCQTVRR